MPKLTWIGKDKVENHHLDVPFRILEHKYGYAAGQGRIEKPTGSGNMIIKGDNLEALKALLPQYEGQVNCIYIDPPYNTGNEGWVYNDNVNDPKIKRWLGEVVGKEGEDLSRHDKWLCMMYPRLRLLHRLLAEDGVIFISIDKNEVNSLKLICDEIFGPNNFLSMFTIKLRHELRILKGDKDYHEVVEFLLGYRKSSAFEIPKIEEDNTSINLYTYKIRELDSGNEISFDNVNAHYFLPGQFEIVRTEPKEDSFKKISIRGTLKEGNSSGRFYMKHLEERRDVLAGCLIKVPNIGDDGLGYRYFLVPPLNGNVNGDYFQGLPENRADVRKIPYPNFFDFVDVFNNVGYEGYGVSFQNGKKPIEFLKHVFKLAGVKDRHLILDSFAGSGSTGDAILHLNSQDGGNRHFILVEREEYAETITVERLRRAVDHFATRAYNAFDFYHLGAPLFIDGLLNEGVGERRIRDYVWFTETRQSTVPAPVTTEPHLLGSYLDTAFYFYYYPDRITSLDSAFLATVQTRTERYVVYADELVLSTEQLRQLNIVFKKIPRDITRL